MECTQASGLARAPKDCLRQSERADGIHRLQMTTIVRAQRVVVQVPETRIAGLMQHRRLQQDDDPARLR